VVNGEDDHEIQIFREMNLPLTTYFALSGWRDLNSRPLDPQIGQIRLSGREPLLAGVRG
jgi:hypothetical protein